MDEREARKDSERREKVSTLKDAAKLVAKLVGELGWFLVDPDSGHMVRYANTTRRVYSGWYSEEGGWLHRLDDVLYFLLEES